MAAKSRTKRSARRLSLERLEERELLSTLITGNDPEAALGAQVKPLGNLLDSAPLKMVGDDFVIAEPLADPEGRQDAGAVYVVFGGEHLEAATLEGCVSPTTTQRCRPLERLLANAQAIRIIGARAGDRAGFSVAAAGNIIGDGKPDLLIGAPRAEQIEGTLEDINTDRGRVYLIGGDFLVNVWLQARAKLDAGQTLTLADVTIDLRDLDPLATTQPGSWQIYQGARPGDQLGYSVAGIGAARVPGAEPFIVLGAPRAESPADPADFNRGAIYVIGGNERMDGGVERSPGVLNVDDLVVTNRGSIVYGPSRDAHLGWSVSGVHDPGLRTNRPDPFSVDASPEPDFLAGAPDACSDNACPGITPDRPGRVYFFPGTLLATPDTRGVYELDNNDDLLALGAIPVQGAQHGDRLGMTVAAAGDFDNDGISDFMFAAPNRDVTVSTPRGERTLPNAGEVYIVFGREVGGNFAQRTDGSGAVTPILVTSFVASSQPIGVTIQGAARGDRTGVALAPTGNIRDPQGALDEVDDLVIGAPLADVKPEFGPVLPDAGRVYLLLGTDAYQIASGTVLPLVTLINSPLKNVGVIFEGRMERQFMGTAVAGVGQVHDSPSVGEGWDLVVGSPGADTLRLQSTVEDAGEVELLFGSPTLGGVLSANVPAGHPNPGPFGPQIIVGGYWTGGPDLPPAGTITQFPLNYGLVGPFSAPYALGGALYYPDKPSAIVDRAGHVNILERRGAKLVVTDVTAQVSGPLIGGTSAVITDRAGRIRYVFGVTPAGDLAWYRRAGKRWVVSNVSAQVRVPALAEGVEAARIRGGFLVVARSRGGALTVFRFQRAEGWSAQVLNGARGPAAPRFSGLPGLYVARPASAKPWVFAYGVTPGGQLTEVRLVGNRVRVRPLDPGAYQPLVDVVTGGGVGRNVIAVQADGALVHLKRQGGDWKRNVLHDPATDAPLVLEAGLAAGQLNGSIYVYAKTYGGQLIEFRSDDGLVWREDTLPGHPTGNSIAQIVDVLPGRDGAGRVLLALDDRGLLVRYAYVTSTGVWDVDFGGQGELQDDGGPATVIDLLVELGLNAR